MRKCAWCQDSDTGTNFVSLHTDCFIELMSKAGNFDSIIKLIEDSKKFDSKFKNASRSEEKVNK